MSQTPAVAAARPTVPAVRRWRARARRLRRAHHSRSLGDLLNDLYMLLWFVLVYGTAAYSEVGRAMAATPDMEHALQRHWLGVALLLAGAGLAWRGLRAVGPLLVTPAEQAWAVSTPMSRRAWLVPRFALVVGAGAAVGALAAVGLALVGPGTEVAGAAVLVGVALGVGVPAAGAFAQGATRGSRWLDRLAIAAVVAGGLTALGVIGVDRTGGALPTLPGRAAPGLLALAIPLAAAAVWAAVRTLPRLDRARLGSGAQLVAAALTSAVWLDPRVFGGVLEVRRWRRVGRVSRRTVRWAVPGLPSRIGGLLAAEVVRLTRRPGPLVVFVALALAQYALAVAAPTLAGALRLVLAYIVAGRFMAGLREVARSAGLRRSLGGRDMVLHGVHAVVPALATVLWWLATEPAAGSGLAAVGGFLAVTVVAAAYRGATAPPPTYGSPVLATPFGPIPTELVMSVVRGPDLLGGVILLRVLLA